jgi:hypothetical protein
MPARRRGCRETSATSGEGGLRCFAGMKRDTLRSPTTMPSLSNSPWVLGAPYLLASAIWRMSALTSAQTSP